MNFVNSLNAIFLRSFASLRMTITEHIVYRGVLTRDNSEVLPFYHDLPLCHSESFSSKNLMRSFASLRMTITEVLPIRLFNDLPLCHSESFSSKNLMRSFAIAQDDNKCIKTEKIHNSIGPFPF